MPNDQSPENADERLNFVILSGGGVPNTTLVLKDDRGTRVFHGPIMSSRERLQNVGTPDWIDQIFVSGKPDPDEAFKAAAAVSQAVLHTPPGHPFHAMGSSLCGLRATLHVVETSEQIQCEVSRMVVDPHRKDGDGRPLITSASVWTDRRLMTPFEIAEFNAIATTASENACKTTPDPLKSDR